VKLFVHLQAPDVATAQRAWGTEAEACSTNPELFLIQLDVFDAALASELPSDRVVAALTGALGGRTEDVTADTSQTYAVRWNGEPMDVTALRSGLVLQTREGVAAGAALSPQPTDDELKTAALQLFRTLKAARAAVRASNPLS
jgi:hypothetical protein